MLPARKEYWNSQLLIIEEPYILLTGRELIVRGMFYPPPRLVLAYH